MPRISITDRITKPDIEMEILNEPISIGPDPDAEILLVWHELIDSAYIDRLPKLRAVVRYGVGFERVDVRHAQQRDIIVCNNPDYCIEEVADSTLAMILNITRGISRLDYLARHFPSGWQENPVPLGRLSSAMVIGVVGAGNIGNRVLEKARAFGFQTLYFDPHVSHEKQRTLSIRGTRRIEVLDELLATADIVSLHLPVTPETEELVDRAFLSTMKRGASLVNTARGRLLKDLDDLLDFLRSGHLSHVALDVLPQEPPAACRLLEAWRCEEPWLEGRLIVNPHKAYLSDVSTVKIRENAAHIAKNILQGNIPHSRVA